MVQTSQVHPESSALCLITRCHSALQLKDVPNVPQEIPAKPVTRCHGNDERSSHKSDVLVPSPRKYSLATQLPWRSSNVIRSIYILYSCHHQSTLTSLVISVAMVILFNSVDTEICTIYFVA